ncbi:MAG: hypothetical protein AVDCRST_MAG42-1279, partial [uncultured Chthoniobacterales bacterium]
WPDVPAPTTRQPRSRRQRRRQTCGPMPIDCKTRSTRPPNSGSSRAASPRRLLRR